MSVLSDEDDSSSNENITEFKEDIAVGKQLTKRPYLNKENFLPSSEEWLEEWNNHKIKRVRFFIYVGCTLLILFAVDSCILLMKILHDMEIENWKVKHTLPSDSFDNDNVHFTSDCVAIYPSFTGIDDWYSLNNLPYAALPRRTGIFARSIFTITFLECYHAFWIGVRPENRQFSNGQLRFMSSSSKGEDNCLQMDPKRRRGNEKGTVGACLTISFNFQLSRSQNLTGVPENISVNPQPPVPVLAYIGGHSMMYHRPRLVSPQVSARLGVLYVTIRYRVGIFGFADFQLPDFGPNHALEDVRKALGWLHDNARVFGGQADDLILFGENAGATIGALLMKSRYQSSEKTNKT